MTLVRGDEGHERCWLRPRSGSGWDVAIQQTSDVVVERHWRGRRDRAATAISKRNCARCGRWTGYDDAEELAGDLSTVTRPESGAEHLPMNPGVWPSPGLRQHMSLTEQLPSELEVTLLYGGCRHGSTAFDLVLDLYWASCLHRLSKPPKRSPRLNVAEPAIRARESLVRSALNSV